MDLWNVNLLANGDDMDEEVVKYLLKDVVNLPKFLKQNRIQQKKNMKYIEIQRI